MVFRFKMRRICVIFLIFIAFCEGDQGQAEAYSEDAKEILQGPVYHWKDWCFCEDRNDLHIWSEAAVLIFVKSSTLGYVWFIIDSRYMIIDSSGRLENSTDSESELQEVRRMIKSTNHTQPILSHAGSTKLVFGNWVLSSQKEGEMNIQNMHIQQVRCFEEGNTDLNESDNVFILLAITLQEGFPGFASESKGKKQTFLAKTTIGAEFSTSWIAGRESNQLRTKAKALKLETDHQSNLTSCSTLNKTKSDNRLTEIQCDTEVCLHNISYAWNIYRFDLHSAEKLLKSTPFFSATYDKIEWYITINLRNKTSDKISLFLMFSPNSTEPEVWARYSVNFLDSKGNLMYTRTLGSFQTFNAECGWGWSDIPINEIVPSDNTLRIDCKIAICLFTTNAFHINRTDTTENPENIRSQDFVSSTKNSETSDVVLILLKTGKEYPANKAKLAARSPVFAAMFNISHPEKGKKIDQVNITNIDSEPVFDELLKYIYTSKFENIDDLAPDLLIAADKYELNNLKELCIEKICNNLTVGNAVDTLTLADRHGFEKLKSKAIRFIAANYAEITITADWKHIVETNSKFVHKVCQVLSNSNISDKEIAEE